MNPYYRPVCGNDMKTYGNKDILDCFNRQRPRNRRKYGKKKVFVFVFEKTPVAAIENSSRQNFDLIVVTINLLFIWIMNHDSAFDRLNNFF